MHQAIKWAIDYEAIAKNITPDTWSVCQAFLPDALPGALKENPFQKDVAKAKQLLAEAGLANGFSVTMDYISASPNSEIAQAIQADLAAIGIKVQLLPGERKQVITKTRARQHQLAMLQLGHRLLRSELQRAGMVRESRRQRPEQAEDPRLAQPFRGQGADRANRRPRCANSIPQSASRSTRPCSKQFMERAPFAMLLQQNAVAVLGKGVSGFKVGPMPDYTHYSAIRKA